MHVCVVMCTVACAVLAVIGERPAQHVDEFETHYPTETVPEKDKWPIQIGQ